MIDCTAMISRLMNLRVSLVLVSLLALASSSRYFGSSPSNPVDPSQRWPLFNQLLGLGGATFEPYGEREVCQDDIPDSVYATHLLRRRRRHAPGDSCPFESVVNYDENRIPAKMTEAKCKCRLCEIPRHISRNVTYTCVPIYQMAPIMQRDTANGEWTYSFQRVSVGCTCRRTRRCRQSNGDAF